ncbi:hypothetical protein JXI42_11885 [bacterium]|nr:hypothetical protein [bacterium]
MKVFKLICLALFLIVGSLYSVPQFLTLPIDGHDSEPAGPDRVPSSNNIGDIIYDGETYMWISSGDGLSKSSDDGVSWESYLANTAFSGLEAAFGWVVAAAAFDTFLETDPNEAIPMGGGIWVSTDGGMSFPSQPFKPLPVTWPDDWIEREVEVGVIGYDVEIVVLDGDTTIWIPAFYGGLLKSVNAGTTWINIFMDPEDTQHDPNAHYDHRFFSFVSDTTTNPPTLWAGTAAGIHKSIDGGESWVTYDHVYDSISGNWIVALAVQYLPEGNVIWAATRATDNPGEFDAISYSRDMGENWTVVDTSVWAWNFTFAGNTVFAATAEGVKRSWDYGENWETLEIVDEETGIWVSVPEIVSVQYIRGLVWAGTYQGLAYSEDLGDTWHLIQTYTLVKDETYGFPSPFSPEHHGTVEIIFPLDNSGNVTITIFDFAMDPVVTIEQRVVPEVINEHKNQGKVQWDGTNSKNEFTSNGVYYFKVETREDAYWGKIAILK